MSLDKLRAVHSEYSEMQEDTALAKRRRRDFRGPAPDQCNGLTSTQRCLGVCFLPWVPILWLTFSSLSSGAKSPVLIAALSPHLAKVRLDADS